MAKLAVNGGTPVRTKPFPKWPVVDGSDEKAVLGVLRSGAWGRLPGSFFSPQWHMPSPPPM